MPDAPLQSSQIDASPADVVDVRSLNLPNAITVSRFLLALVLFWLMDQEGWWRTSAAVFIAAALTDYLDGYLARKYGQITVLGRILDPFVDKLIVCGAFVFLVARPASGVTAWMAFVVLAREMFITSLRSILEQRGRDFSAKFWGKLKMAVQCVAVPLCLLSLSPEFRQTVERIMTFDKFLMLRNSVLWLTVAVTVYSGVEYCWRAFWILRKPH